jgi:hypothetical protein
MDKPDTHGRVKAAKVFDIIPNFQAMAHSMLHVKNEDVEIEENMPHNASEG